MRKTHSNLTRERLQEVLYYDPETGEFRWKVSLSRRIKVGDVAGCLTDGYRQIEIDHTVYVAHRLAWLYQTGDWPTKFIDHINGIRSDNRFVNLREATTTQNAQNSRSVRGKSIWRGVCWETRKKRWRAMIRVNGKQRHLGYFEDEEKAAEAYQSAQRLFHPFAPGSDTIRHAR